MYLTAAVLSQPLVQQIDVCCASVEGKLVARKSESTALLLVTHLHGGRKLSSCAVTVAGRSVCLDEPGFHPFRPPFPCEERPAANVGVITKEIKESVKFLQLQTHLTSQWHRCFAAFSSELEKMLTFRVQLLQIPVVSGVNLGRGGLFFFWECGGTDIKHPPQSPPQRVMAGTVSGVPPPRVASRASPVCDVRVALVEVKLQKQSVPANIKL